jgi:hypothetical protein
VRLDCGGERKGSTARAANKAKARKRQAGVVSKMGGEEWARRMGVKNGGDEEWVAR